MTIVTLLTLLASFIFGCIVTSYSMHNACEHKDKLESTTTYYWDENRKRAEFRIKHYQCEKCLRIKSVRVG